MHTIRCARGHRHQGETPVAAKAAVFRCARGASNLAANVKAAVPPVVTPEPRPWPFITPEQMVRSIRDGYYAVAPSGNDAVTSDHVFLRISHPKTGKRKGAMVVQTQHSDDYRPFITFWPSGKVYVAQRGTHLDNALMMVAADPFTCAQRYSKIFEVCSRCHKQLTDKRSRWYGIGPECEKHWPEIINEVNETRGVFVPTY